MKKYLFFGLFCFLPMLLMGQEMQFPVIKNGGGIFPVPEAESIGEWRQPYKIVTEITAGMDKPDLLNKGLERIARLVNLYHHSGVLKENIDIHVMIHFMATSIILTDEAHQKKFDCLNPNTTLINEMAANGVKFYVCGQSIYRGKMNKEPRNPNIKVILSAMTGITTLQMKGYTFMP